MKKGILTLLVAVVASLSLSHAAIVNGACGDNLTWSLNTKEKTLTVEGSGQMTNWSSTSSWYEYRSYINYVSLPDGLTSIGDLAFNYCTNLTSVTIPQSVMSIGVCAFQSCESLTTIEIPNNTTNIAHHAFYENYNLTSVTIGNNVISIGEYAFAYSTRISSITCRAITPPTLESGVFLNVNKSIPLYVPAESIEAYQDAFFWDEFTNIQAIPAQNPVVKFLDWDGTVLSSAEVEEGTAATPPVDPMREGYTFIGWDKDFSNITEDLIVTAQYKINRYKVDFKDWNEAILKSDSVDWNTAAVAPTNPSRLGYTFTGWDKEFSNITTDLVVTAQYEYGVRTDFTINFNTKDGDEILSNSVVIKVPIAPEIDNFTFLRWEVVGGALTDTIEIQAVYQANTPTSAPEVVTNPANPAQKLIREGNVYILKGDKTYTLQGQVVQ